MKKTKGDIMSLKAGIFENENEEIYHASEGYISSSPLPELDKSPAHFYEKWQNGVEPTPAMDKGTFIHKIGLEQDISKYVARPLKEDGSLIRSNSKEYLAFAEANVGKKIIDAELFENANDILNALCANKFYLKTFDKSHKEISFYGSHHDLNLPVKARLDLCDKDYKFIRDLKSCADIMKFEKQIFTMGYDVRLVHYAETVRSAVLLATGERIPEILDLGFIVIESKAPYATRNIKLTPVQVMDAKARYKQYMNTIAACKQDGKWPAFSDDEVYAVKPKFLDDVEDVDFAVGF